MTAFTEIEQETLDIDWFAIDRDGRVGHFAHGGFQLLPPTVAKNKETLEKLKNFFDDLPSLSGNSFTICPDFESRKETRHITNIERHIKSYAEMSKKGLYSYDSSPNVAKRPYIRITIPKQELKLNDLPEDIRETLESLRLSEINFTENSLISGEIASKV